jgi:hypothetical protein
VNRNEFVWLGGGQIVQIGLIVRIGSNSIIVNNVDISNVVDSTMLPNVALENGIPFRMVKGPPFATWGILRVLDRIVLKELSVWNNSSVGNNSTGSDLFNVVQKGFQKFELHFVGSKQQNKYCSLVVSLISDQPT